MIIDSKLLFRAVKKFKENHGRVEKRVRVKWIDVLKCIGIFEIYLGHFGEAAGKLYPFVFTHHVPLFFFISGCVENYNKDAVWKTVQKKFITLLVPFYFLVYYLLFFTAYIMICPFMKFIQPL